MSASRQFLNQGIDPSLTGNWSPAQAADLTQLIQEAVPNTTAPPLGWIVTQASAPDVVTHPEYAYCLWCKPVSSTVQELYKWNGSAWQKTSATAVIGAGSIPLSALATDLASAGKILQYDVSGALQPVTLASTLSDNSIQPIKFANATLGSRYIFMSDEVTGVFSRVLWSAALNEYLTTEAMLPINRLADTEGAGATNQVVYKTAPNGPFGLGNCENLIGNNALATAKLNLGGAPNAGKTVKVNGNGTDLEYETAQNVQFAVLWFGGAAGTAPDSTTAGVDKTLSWSNETDPDSIVTLAANQITFAATGYYLLQIIVPFISNSGSSKGRMYLYDTTALAEVAGMNKPFIELSSIGSEVTATFLVNVTDASHVYEVRCKTAGASYLSFQGASVNYDGGDERYQQMTITRLL